LAQTTFIGRKAELQRLEEFLTKATAEQLQVASLTGESDTVKSEALKSQTREAIQFIANHIHEDEMQSQFLQSEGVGMLIA
jgi:hypothetical protein